MNHPNAPRIRGLLACGLIAVVGLILGCGGGGTEKGEETATHGVSSTADTLGVSHQSVEGHFDVDWPEGCDKLRVRQKTDEFDHVEVVYTYCDRPGHENEGCSVVSHFALRDDSGGPPTPQVVTGLVKTVMESFHVEIQTQHPVVRGGAQGVQVHCREPGSTGEVWIEGLLAGDRVYILTAWKGAGGLFDDPEYKRFFASFKPTEG